MFNVFDYWNLTFKNGGDMYGMKQHLRGKKEFILVSNMVLELFCCRLYQENKHKESAEIHKVP